ncbi:hypothetical protein ACFSKL_09585 [Belliella marina]|uniref:Uncharacterized protein n=1 Tax=Belliella marina TaxID=1644146 RepID=A0ABW4VJY2_9BACT
MIDKLKFDTSGLAPFDTVCFFNTNAKENPLKTAQLDDFSIL